MWITVAMSNLNEDRLLKELIESNENNLLNIPVAKVGEILHVELGLVLKKIIKVVRETVVLFSHKTRNVGQCPA